MSRRSSQGAGGGSAADFVSVAPPPVMGELSVNSSTMMIKSVHMFNFMMNKDVVVDFGNRLNFICGPNGSGKSTVLCAILVGLCGDTKNLGRATAEKTFIKSGEDFLKTVITLSYTSGSRNDVVVTRKVTQTASTSSIDGRKLSKEDVLAWVQNQNIQFDNLCHFMAQTRVRFFAQLAQKPRDFLLQVEEAVGPPGQADLHRWLISQSSEKQIAEKNKEQLINDLERHKEKQKSLDLEMQRYQTLIDIQKQLESAEDFRPHLLADTEQQRYDEKKLLIEPLKQEVAAKERSLQGVRDLVAQKKSEMNRAEKAVDEAGKGMRRLREDASRKCSDAENFAREVERAGNDLRDAQQDVEAYHTRREECVEQVRIAKDNLDRETKKLDDLRRQGNFDQMERDKKALTAELRRFENEMNDAGEKKARLQQDLNRLNAQLNAASNQRRRRFEQCIQRMQNGRFKGDVEKMYRFIDRMKEQNSFRGEVLGPLAMELEFSDNTQAKLVQASLGFKQRYMFIFAEKNDFQLANDFLIRDKLTCVIFDTSSLPRGSMPPPLSQQQLKQLGLAGFLTDLVHDAPEMIKVFLNQKANFGRIIYGPDSVVGKKDTLLRARQMTNNAISQGIGIATGNPRNPGDVRFFVHRVVVRGTNIGFAQESQNEPSCIFTVGKQAETDTSALQAKLESLSDEVESQRVQEEAAGNKTRAARAKLREVDERLKEPQNIESLIRTLARRHKEALESLKESASVEQLEQTVSKKAASLKKKIETFAQNYAIAVDVQPQVKSFGI
jgi:chromosome segregation ATPase